MNFSKSYISRVLIDHYICMPMRLKQQALTHIALNLCCNSSIKKQIFDPDLKTAEDSSPKQVRVRWEKLIKKKLTRIIKKLFLPQILQEQLFDLIRSLALQLLFFSGKWKHFCNIPCSSTAELWLPTDFIENRLHERKIAERVMEDDKFTPDQRYRVACLYCLKEFISPLWNQLSPEMKKELVSEESYDKSNAIGIWSLFLGGRLTYENEEDFFFELFKIALAEHQAPVFIFSWQRLAETVSRRMGTLFVENSLDFKLIMKTKKQVLPFKEDLKIQLPRSPGQGDLICYSLMKVRELKLPGWEARLKYSEPFVEFFLEWPEENISLIKHL